MVERDYELYFKKTLTRLQKDFIDGMIPHEVEMNAAVYHHLRNVLVEAQEINKRLGKLYIQITDQFSPGDEEKKHVGPDLIIYDGRVSQENIRVIAEMKFKVAPKKVQDTVVKLISYQGRNRERILSGNLFIGIFIWLGKRITPKMRSLIEELREKAEALYSEENEGETGGRYLFFFVTETERMMIKAEGIRNFSQEERGFTREERQRLSGS